MIVKDSSEGNQTAVAIDIIEIDSTGAWRLTLRRRFAVKAARYLSNSLFYDKSLLLEVFQMV